MKIIPGTHLVSSYSKSRTFAGGMGERWVYFAIYAKWPAAWT